MTKHLRSTVEGREPVVGASQGQLDTGEIALNINAANPFLCFADNAGVVRRLGVWVSSSPPASPSKGELWLDTTSTPQIRCYDGASWSSGGAADGFPSGTRMLFQQTAAPPGWTKETAHNNKALRVVSGAAGTGGSVEFTTAFSAQGITGTVGSTALTTAQLPAHSHGVSDGGHSHTISDPGHSHGYHDPGHSHHYTITNGWSGDSPTTGQNEQAHVRGLSQESVWTEHRYTGIQIHGSGTGIGVNGGGANVSIQNTGGGQGHTHSLSGASVNLAVTYVDVIIAVKN